MTIKQIILDKSSAEMLLNVLWNMALADSLISEEEIAMIEQVALGLGLSASILKTPSPLEEILPKVKDEEIKRAIYASAYQVANADQCICQLEQELLDIIREYFSISDDENEKLSAVEYRYCLVSHKIEKQNDSEGSEWEKAGSAFMVAGRLSLKALSRLAKDYKEKAKSATSKGSFEKYQNALKEVAALTWTNAKEAPELAIERYKKMPKSMKILALSAMAGGAMVSIPFIIAVGPLTIVQAIATMGLAIGSYHVSGGIIVTVAGTALSSAFAAAAASKCIKDPEIEQLKESFFKLETIIKQNFTTINKHQEQYKKLYEKYGRTAEFIALLQQKIEKNEKYDLEAIKDNTYTVKHLIEDLQTELAQGKK